MAMKRSQVWAIGDFFTVELADGSYGIGQVVDVPLPNAVSCAFFSRRVSGPIPEEAMYLTADDVMGAATVVPAHLDQGVWKVFKRGAVLLAQHQWPNEPTRSRRWVGFKIYTGAILEDFLNAYYALAPWDRFHDPHYLDRLLISPTKKPPRLIYNAAGETT